MIDRKKEGGVYCHFGAAYPWVFILASTKVDEGGKGPAKTYTSQ